MPKVPIAELNHPRPCIALSSAYSATETLLSTVTIARHTQLVWSLYFRCILCSDCGPTAAYVLCLNYPTLAAAVYLQSTSPEWRRAAAVAVTCSGWSWGLNNPAAYYLLSAQSASCRRVELAGGLATKSFKPYAQNRMERLTDRSCFPSYLYNFLSRNSYRASFCHPYLQSAVIN